MKTGKQKIYWDSNIFLAWLKNEQQEPSVTDGIEEAIRKVRNNEIVLFTSVMTRTEVLESTLPPEAQDKFSKLFDRRNVTMVNIDKRVSDKAHSIRDYYRQKNIKLSSADCMHLATAILYSADEFQTLDGSGKRKRPNDLIPLNGNVAGHNLKICVPHAVQTTMFSGLSSPGRRKITLEE